MCVDYVYFKVFVVRLNFGNLILFIIMEVFEEEECDDFEFSDVGLIVFENLVFVEWDILGSCIYEFNFFYIFDVILEVDFIEV